MNCKENKQRIKELSRKLRENKLDYWVKRGIERNIVKLEKVCKK